MAKIDIHVILKTPEQTYDYIVPAIYQKEEKTIVYKEKDEDKTLVKFNYSTKELYRENDSLIMTYKFNKNKNSTGTIYVKAMDRKLELTISTKSIQRDQNNIEIDYFVEKEKYKYKIEVI